MNLKASVHMTGYCSTSWTLLLETTVELDIAPDEATAAFYILAWESLVLAIVCGCCL